MIQFEVFLNKHSLTTCGLAKRAGLYKSQISEYRRGIHKPSKRTVARIAIALKLPIADVLAQIPSRETNQNHPVPPVYCPLCHRKMYKLRANPEQFDGVQPLENRAVAA
jgi:transcriptional regulator with XRE-family HTH domain